MYGLRLCKWPLFALALFALAAAPAVQAGPVDEQYAVAAGHYDQQRYAAAITEFRKFIEDHPGDPRASDATFFLAESLLQTGEYLPAAQTFEQFTTAQPRHRLAAQASFRIGEAAYLQGDFAAALPKLQAFAATYANHKLAEYALPYLAECQLETGDPTAAQANYQAALKNHPGGPLAGDCRLGLGRIAQQQGDLVEAERFYSFLAQRDDSATASEAKVRLGQLKYHQRDFTGAANYLQPLAKAANESPQRTVARYWLGFVLIEQKQSAAAHKLWQQAITDNATHTLAAACALALAESFAVEGKAEEAGKWCERIAKDWPKSDQADDALALQTQLAFHSERYDDVARFAAQFAQEHAASSLLSRVNETLGRTQIAQGKFPQAIKTLQGCIDPSAPDPQLLHSLALAQLGEKQFDAVLATLKKIDLQEADEELQASVLMTQGSTLVALGRGAEAVAPLKAYLANHAQQADAAKAYAQLCVAHAQAKQFGEATAAWKKFSAKHASDRSFSPTTLYLAEAAAEAGESAAAQAWFDALTADNRPAEIRERALAGLAWLAEHEKSPAAANERLGDLLKKQPVSPQAAAIALRRAQNFEASGERDNALAAYLAFIKEYTEAPQLPDALLAAARLHDELSQDREALVLVERLLKEHPKYAHTDAALYQAAWVLTDLEKREAASKHFARLHDEHRESQFWFDATYRLAEHHVREKRHDHARAVLDVLIAAKPVEDLLCHALYLQGQAAAAQGKWTDAMPPLVRLVADHPRHDLRIMAEYWLAESEYRTGKLTAAAERLGDLSTRLDGRTDAWLPMVPLRQAQILAHEKRWQEAHDLAVTIAARYPEFRQQYEVDYLLGRALGALAKFDDARKAYDRVVQSPIGGRTETAAMAQWMIGETYFQQERYADAIAAYHRVEKLFAYERWQAAALLQAGKCHETQAQYRDAISLYAQLLKDYSQTTFAAEASQRLRVAEQRATAAANTVERR